MSLFLFLFIILLFLFNSVTSTAMSYNILSSSGNYIVSTALPNKNVFVVMSTSSGASYMIYDDTGSVIKELTLLNATETTQLSSYAAGANLKAISNDLVVLAEGKNFHLITVADGIITKSVQWITSSITSTFISLTANQSQKFFVIAAAISGNLKIAEYDETGTIKSSLVSISSSYPYIDCITFEDSTSNTLCVFNTQQNVGSYAIYGPNFEVVQTETTMNQAANNNKYNFEPSNTRITYGQKSALLDSSIIALCILKNSYLMCQVLQMQSTSIIKLASLTSGDGAYATANNCSTKIEFTSIAKLNTTSFATICQETTTSNYIYSVLSYNEVGDLNFLICKLEITGITSTASYITLHSFSSKVVGYFYNSGTEGRFLLYGYPNCEDYELTTEYFYNENGTLSFSSYVANGLNGDTGTLRVNVNPQDITDSSISSVIIKSGTSSISTSTFYSLSALSFNTGRTEGIIKYKFYPVSSTGLYLKYCKLIFTIKPCYESCNTCSSTGVVNDHQCDNCLTTSLYYPLTIDTLTGVQCYKESEAPDRYYLDKTTSPYSYKKCYIACTKCSTLGTEDDTKCLANKCDTDYYPLIDKTTQCYLSTKTVNYYYFDTNIFKACYTGCLTCSTIGTSQDDTKCTACDTTNSFYPKLVADTVTEFTCYSAITKPTNYFLNSDLKYEECYTGCATCAQRGTGVSDTKCSSCDTTNDYFPLFDKTTQCYKNDPLVPVDGYYFNVDKFSKCYTGCATCSSFGTSVNDTKCTSCNTAGNYFPLSDDSTQCYYYTNKPNKYYFNGVDKFEKCNTACLTCSELGPNVDETKCLICDKDNLYYPLSDKSSQCYLRTSTIDHYYYNANNYRFEPCNAACLQCTSYGPSVSNTLCTADKCATNYMPVVNQTTQCYSKSTIVNHLYQHSDGYFHYCYDTCLTCTQEGNADDNALCDSCDVSRGFFPLENKTSDCYSITTKPAHTFKSSNGKIMYCNKACDTCSASGTVSYSNCDSCLTGYYPLATNSKVCLNDEVRDLYYPKYYLNFASLVYEQCNNECATCSMSPDNCNTCVGGYFKIDGTNTCVGVPPSGYYLDNSDVTNVIYKKCHENCATCSQAGTDAATNCDTCKEGYITPYYPTQCEEPCADGKYFYFDQDDGNKYKCVASCEEPYKYIVEDNKQCTYTCELPRYIYENNCLTECPEDTAPASEDSNVCEDTDVCKKKELTSEVPLASVKDSIDQFGYDYSQDYLNTDKYVEIITSTKKSYTITIFKSEECASSVAFDLLMLDLANCPSKLRDKYSIPADKPLIVLKMDIPRDGQTNQLAYAFYHYLTGARLDLSICAEETITVLVPMNTTEGVNITQAIELAEIGVDVYNSSDPFFNDICFEYTSDSGKDVTLADRRKEYYQNVSFCEEGCEYQGVNLETQEANCSCQVKTDFVAEIFDNPITGDFLELINAANFEVVVCYDKVFTASYWFKNIGGWIIVAFMIIQLAFAIVYMKTGLMPIRIFLLQYMKMNPPQKSITPIVIEDMINRSNIEQNDSMKNNVIIDDEKDNQISNEEPHVEEKAQLPIQDENLIDIEAESPELLMSNKPNKKLVLMVLNHNYVNEGDNKSLSESNSSKNLNYSFDRNDLQLNTTMKQEIEKVKKQTKKKKELIIDKRSVRKLHPTEKDKLQPDKKDDDDEEEEFDEDDLDEMELYDAIIYDHRPFCLFYWQQIKQKEAILNTFVDINVLEPFPMKAICFFLNAALIFTLNGLLYTEDEISAHFYAEENNSFLYLLKNELSRIVYCSMISIVVDFFLDCLFSSKRRIEILIKREKDMNVFREESISIIKTMRLKYIVFMVVDLILMLLFWYYCCAFCNCYPNTTMSWLYSSIVTWVVILLFPFLLCFLVAALRYLGLKYKWEVAYKISACLTE